MLLRSFIPTARRQPSRSRSASTWVERRVSARAGGDPVLLPAEVFAVSSRDFLASSRNCSASASVRSTRSELSAAAGDDGVSSFGSLGRWWNRGLGGRVREQIVECDRKFLECGGEAAEPAAGEDREPRVRIGRLADRRAASPLLCYRPCDCRPNTFSHSALVVTHRMPIRSPLRSFPRLPVRPYRGRRARVRNARVRKLNR